MSLVRNQRQRARVVERNAKAQTSPQMRSNRRSVRPPVVITWRGSRPLRADMRVRYAVGVAERSIDREAWANVVSQLVARETKGNKSKFATLVGVTYKTVLRWMNQEATVSEESVRQVARAVGVSPLELLVRVGYYDAADLAASPSEPVEAGGDKALQVILDADVPPRVKQRMIQRLHELREREVDEVKFWIDQARGA